MRNSPEIIFLPINEVKPHPNHARVHNRRQLAKLERLLREYGQVMPIAVDKYNEIVDGHAVYEVWRKLGYEEIKAVVIDRAPAEIRALRLALNRLPQDARWDDERLRCELKELLELGFDTELTGFDAIEIDTVLSIDVASAGVIEEEEAEILEPGTTLPITRLGDTWRLGPHTIWCGDARNCNRACELLGQARATAVFTDPPYNVRIEGNVSGLGRTHHSEFAMASGEMRRDEFVAFLAAFITPIVPKLVDGAILFICMDWRHIGELLEAAARHQLQLKNLCVWVKSNAGMGSFYRSQHELVFVFKHGSGPHQNNFGLGGQGRSRSNVWQYKGVNAFGKDRMELLGSHPTVKPVLMIADALRDVTRRGDLVLDPFLGSGSTLLAAEETGRVCVGIELDPGYVDVAIRRWQKRTGKDAIHADTGETFSARSERTNDPPPALAHTDDQSEQARGEGQGQ